MTLRDSDKLNLPEAPEFISRPPAYSASEMIELCEKMLPYWNQERYAQEEPAFVGDPFSLAEDD